MLISTSKFFKGNKIARASRGSEDFDFHHKIYLISTEVLKSFHDSPPHWQFICSHFSKKNLWCTPKILHPLPSPPLPSPPLQKINNDHSLRLFLWNRTCTEIFVWSVNKKSEAGHTPGDFIWYLVCRWLQTARFNNFLEVKKIGMVR